VKLVLILEPKICHRLMANFKQLDTSSTKPPSKFKTMQLTTIATSNFFSLFPKFEPKLYELFNDKDEMGDPNHKQLFTKI
jgi:hypothetical protein